MAGGRPSTYDAAKTPKKAEKLLSQGLTIEGLAVALDVHPDTVYEWMKVHEEFSEAVTRGRAKADSIAEAGLYRRACGFEYDETYREVRQFLPKPADEKKIVAAGGQVTDYLDANGLLTEAIDRTIHKVVPADVQAIGYWLGNRKPGVWRNVKAVEVSGPNGGPVKTEGRVLDLGRLSDDKLAQLEAILEVAEDERGPEGAADAG